MNTDTTPLDLAKAALWAQLTKGYPRRPDPMNPGRMRTAYVVDEHNAPVLAELANYLVGAPCRWAQPGAGLLLAGGVGSGKTDIMRALSRTITAGGGDGFEVLSCVELVALHDRTGRDERDTGGARVILQYGNKPADLCLDDLGEEPEGRHFGATRDVVAEVVALRYNLWKRRGFLTHFTTNIVTDEALVKRYGQRTADRVLEMARALPVEGPSRRSAATPVAHERPVLFEVPPPMPTAEEQAERERRSAEQWRSIREAVEGAAHELKKGRVVSMTPSPTPSTREEHLALFVASIESAEAADLESLRDRVQAVNSEAAAAPYVQAIERELARRPQPATASR
jgi:hypothetical protein